LSRAVESRKPPIPVLADLRESGAIEQDADIVLFIYREEVYESDSEKKGIADILVRKHRNGPISEIGQIQLFFHDKFAKFESLDKRESV
jgi:replicative DNA helicase